MCINKEANPVCTDIYHSEGVRGTLQLGMPDTYKKIHDQRPSMIVA